jgi:hypothetical protein
MTRKRTAVRRGRERRTSERADAQLSMRVDAGAVAGTTKLVTESQNISASGVYCHASHFLAPLSKVQLTIVLPRTPGAQGPSQELVKCDAIVVRCNQRAGDRSETPYELACMFSGLAAELRRRIEEFVTWRNLQALRAALSPPVKRARAVAGRTTAATKTTRATASGASATRKRTARSAGRSGR